LGTALGQDGEELIDGVELLDGGLGGDAVAAGVEVLPGGERGQDAPSFGRVADAGGDPFVDGQMGWVIRRSPKKISPELVATSPRIALRRVDFPAALLPRTLVS
jgi:hypothetical protein